MSTQTVTQAIAAWPFSLASGELLGVALSGGADSTALLLATARRWPGQVVALHVNHGLQTAANEFETHCANLCSKLNVPLLCIKVNAHARAGESPEDAARKARYAALVKLCSQEGRQQIKSVALGQHADDQVETLLLALSRGSGLAGVAGMPSKFERAGLMFHRPLLNLSSSQIRQWLRAEGLDWVEDPTNTDLRYTRNRIRAKLLPALEETFPQFRDTFARSARHTAQANELLLEFAQLDLQTVGKPVQICALQSLSVARQANVVRLWLANTYGEHARPNTAQLDELLSQIEACTTRGHKLHIKVGSGYIHRDGDVLVWQKSA
jgi:tRNA(Ile)-lysidine synthase